MQKTFNFLKRKKFLIFSFLILLLAFYLRFYQLDTLTSPYWEEVALAYDSYSLLETGKDYHNNPWPIAAVESFGDYKASFYFYALIPFIKIFGLNTFAVRMPSFLAGLLIVLGTAFLAENLLYFLSPSKKENKYRKDLFLITLFFTSISTWAIMFSRAAWEANLATALLIWAINFFFYFQKNNQKFYLLPLSAILFILSSYTYHAQKITAPLTASILFVFYLIWKKKKKLKLKKSELINLFLTAILAFILFLPLLQLGNTAAGQQRFKETSIFSESQIIEYSNQKRLEADDALWARIYYHRYLLFSKKIFANFLTHFKFDYLFLNGDGLSRHNAQIFGQLYYLDFIFLILSLYFLYKKKNLYALFPFLFLITSILPSSLTVNTPHSLRSLASMPMFIIMISFAFWQILIKLEGKKRFLFLVTILLTYSSFLFIFFNFYTKVYPARYASYWQDGYEEAMTTIAEIDDGKKKIYFSKDMGRPAIYHWFFNKIDPREVQKEELKADQDQGELTVYKNWLFIDKADEIHSAGIVVFPPSFYTSIGGHKKIIKEVKNKSGDIVLQIIDYRP